MSNNIEAMFGGALALGVLGFALYAMTNAEFGGAPASGTGDSGAANPTTVQTPSGPDMTPVLTAEGGADLICECYDEAFSLAGKVDVLSPEYRTGFQQCRARGGVDGGDAWTAGWNARLSAKPYETSCRAYKRRK